MAACIRNLGTALILAAILVVAQSDQNFTVGLYNNIALQNMDIGRNIALSPFSANSALSIMFTGAAGATRAELAATLNLDPSATGTSLAAQFALVLGATFTFSLQSANGIFLDKSYDILPSFNATVIDDFAAELASVDFANHAEAARQQINAYVDNKTNHKIHELFEHENIDSSTELLLVNALYFKADWAKPFEKERTSPQNFTRSDGQQKTVNLMHDKHHFSYAESDVLLGAQVLEMPYKNADTSMVLILPKIDTGLQGLENSLTSASLQAALNELQREDVIVEIPKFDVCVGYDLGQTLMAMGTKSAFSDGADFSGISSRRDLKISKVVQKVFVSVNEKGTEAAAATGIQTTTRSLSIDMQEPKHFRADRPFLFLIMHKLTNTTLFMGRIADPTAERCPTGVRLGR